MKWTRIIRVLVVESDAAFGRAVVANLARERDIEPIGPAVDAFIARDLILQRHPDVILLGLRLPRVGGLLFLRRLREAYPVPVVVWCDPGARDGPAAMHALRLGALDLLERPTAAADFGRAVRDAAERLRVAARESRPFVAPAAGLLPQAAVAPAAGIHTGDYLVCIGASTGGPETIALLLSRVASDFPPTVIVQHMPANFTGPFARRLDAGSRLRVREASDGETIGSGDVIVAPGGLHLTVHRSGAAWQARLSSGAPVNSFRPSVDVLFRSASAYGKRAVGVLLTGMGRDGADGLSAMRSAGALTIAQDAGSCVVYGMPKAAVEVGAAELTARPESIPTIILQRLAARRQRRQAASI